MNLLLAFLDRLRKKLMSIAPLVAAGIVVFAVVWLILYLVRPFLPEPWQDAITVAESAAGSRDWEQVRQARDQFRAILESSELGIEITFVLFQALQVIVAPIPGQLAGLLGGAFFGFWLGLLLTMTGLSIGSLIAMSLGRWFGVQLVRRFVPADLMAKLDHLIARGGLLNFLIIFALPALPDDAICFVAGMTRFSLWKLMLVMFAGRLPGMAVLNYVGAYAVEGSISSLILFGAAMALSFVLWLYSEELEAKVFGVNEP
jgi:uncharacterized membrane protein YdjX (TVP38/TMEM64 family)